MTEGESRGTRSGSHTGEPLADGNCGAVRGNGDHPDPPSDATGKLPMTDGGSDEFGTPDPDDDPFVWPDDRDQSDTARTDATDGDAREDPVADQETGAKSGVSDQPPTHGERLPEGLDAMEERLDRLDTVAEDLNIAAINAGLKHARGEEADLATLHKEVETYAERVDAEVERISSILEHVRDELETLAAGQGPGHQAAAGSLPRGSQPSPTVTVRAGWENPRDTTGLDSGIVVGVDDDAENGKTPTVAPNVDPVEFLIPGAKLRDMWRATWRNEYGESARDGERWILETTPREEPGTDALEFPPEVTEFTLDPDELSFADVLDLVDVDDE